VPRNQRIPHPREHIGNGVCCHRFSSLLSTFHSVLTQISERTGRLVAVVRGQINQPSYQLAFVTPGISPARASLRKQIRHSENLRRKPRGRPQLLQRLRSRHTNFGFFCSLAIFAVVAMNFPYALVSLTGETAFP
jgi:hypothetical protein